MNQVPLPLLKDFVQSTAAALPSLAFAGPFAVDENGTAWTWSGANYVIVASGTGGGGVIGNVDGGTSGSTEVGGFDGGSATSTP